MKSISDLLSKFSRLIKDSADKLETIRQTVQENTGIDLPVSAIKKQNSTLFISAHPAIKSEIALRKEKIISDLKSQKIIISDIR